MIRRFCHVFNRCNFIIVMIMITLVTLYSLIRHHFVMIVVSFSSLPTIHVLTRISHFNSFFSLFYYSLFWHFWITQTIDSALWLRMQVIKSIYRTICGFFFRNRVKNIELPQYVYILYENTCTLSHTQSFRYSQLCKCKCKREKKTEENCR